MQAGARLRKDPEASPKTQLKRYRPGSVFPNGSQITNMAKTPTAISAVWVLIRPYLSATPPAISRPIVEHLVSHIVSCQFSFRIRTVDGNDIHVQKREKNHTSRRAEPLHHNVGRV
jgi:hypothetical protein